MRTVLDKKLRIWEQLERPLLEAHRFQAATISSSGVTIGSSSLAQYNGATVRSSIADARVAPNETKSKPKEAVEYEKEEEEEEGCSGRDLNPGSATRKSSILLI